VDDNSPLGILFVGSSTAGSMAGVHCDRWWCDLGYVLLSGGQVWMLWAHHDRMTVLRCGVLVAVVGSKHGQERIHV